jgi:hypothetical protein
LIPGAFRVGKSANATSRRQKSDNDVQEKFDCVEHARRFDLIRSLWPMVLLVALSCAFVSASDGLRTSQHDPRRRMENMGGAGIVQDAGSCGAEPSWANARGVATQSTPRATALGDD